MPKSESKSTSQQECLPSIESQGEERFLDNILSQGDSYEVLKTCSSGGAHFQFKSEKLWTLAETPVNSRFRVPISLMSENFNLIPFDERKMIHSRYCYDELVSGNQYSINCVISTETTRDTLDEDTLLSMKLDELDEEWLGIIHNTTRTKSKKLPTVSSTAVAKESTDPDHDTGKPHSNSVPKSSNQQAQQKENSKQNLEDWLDSILDD